MSNRYAQFDALLAKMKQIHDAKGHDYEGDGRPYENLRAGEDWNIEAWKYAMLRADEKMRRLKSFAKKGTLKNESALDSFLDIAVLAAIGYVLFEEETATATPPPQSRASACTLQSPCVPHPAPAPASPSCSTD